MSDIRGSSRDVIDYIITDACASGSCHYSYSIYTMQCPRRAIAVDVNMTQMRSTSNPAYDDVLMGT